MEQGKQRVLVAGDFVLDHHIYEGRRHHYGDGTSPGVRVVLQTGGAALVHQVLQHLFASDASGWASRLAVADPVEVAEDGTRSLAFPVDCAQHAYAFWRPTLDRDGTSRYWRVSEAMGFGASGGRTARESWGKARLETAAPAEILVLSDGGSGFRDDEGCWKSLGFAAARWIVLKTGAPLDSGALWRMLTSEEHRARLVVVIAADDLRESAARVPAGLSWDATVASLLRELRPGRPLAPLTRCRHLVVSFGSEGGLWIDFAKRDGERPADDCPVHFVYEAGSIEGEHAHAVKDTAFGLQSCLAAAVTWELTRAEAERSFARAVERGLTAMRDLRQRGHGGIHDAVEGFPAERLAKVMGQTGQRLSRAGFAFGAPVDSPSWSLLGESLRRTGPAYELAQLVARRGTIALANVPHLRVGRLFSADHREIESLRSLVQVIRRYRDARELTRPLSIGVFGPPGAGKSFAVREIARTLEGRTSWLEFNLSQLASPEDLIGAFHQIRDQVLHGALPIAFFDEFDSQHHRWLQHLLAPMQDGRFQDGQLTHGIGKCIFVCAGGTSWTFRAFGPPEGSEQAGREASKAWSDFRSAKGPDFKSRLDAYLDVSGPNQREVCPPPTSSWHADVSSRGGHPFARDPGDVHFPIRRALMIRANLRRGDDDLLEIDAGLLDALLEVSVLRHGSRSLEKLLEPFQVAGVGALRRSQLFAAEQLDMHVPGQEFLDLLEQGRPREVPVASMSDDEVAIVADAIHRTWRALGRREGWLASHLDKDFADLDDFYRGANESAALRMERVLALVGLRLGMGPGSEEQSLAVERHLEFHLELLADAEHRGWMQWHLQQGWRYGEKRDEAKRLHPCLRPFSQLSESERGRDRNAVRHFDACAHEAGRAIEFVD